MIFLLHLRAATITAFMPQIRTLVRRARHRRPERRGGAKLAAPTNRCRMQSETDVWTLDQDGGKNGAASGPEKKRPRRFTAEGGYAVENLSMRRRVVPDRV